MSTEFLSDREQEEALRNWWRENWSWVLSGVVVGFVGLGAWTYWRGQIERKAESAASAFRELTSALAVNDKGKVETVAKKLETEYSDSPYSDQAHLLLAQEHVSAGRFEMAATELKAVADKSKDEALAQVAKLRLARVHIQLGHYDEALAMLSVSADKKGSDAFSAQIQEIRGDASLAKGDASAARTAYEGALAVAEADPNRNSTSIEYLQLKLKDLPVAAPAAPATPSASSGTAPAPTPDK